MIFVSLVLVSLHSNKNNERFINKTKLRIIMTKDVIHIVNSRALGGGIGTVLDYLQEGLNQSRKQ